MLTKIKRSIRRNIFVIKSTFLIYKIKRILNKNYLSHLDKVEKIISAQILFGINDIVETGTYLGTTTNYIKKYFKNIFSIELSKTLADEAKRYFKNKKNIQIIQGDSGIVLENIIIKNYEKKLFWLDAHYSSGITASSTDFGDTPISKEIEIILKYWSPESIILIDDARLFNGKNNYPSIDNLKNFIKTKNLHLNFFIDKDIIHIL